MRAVTFTGAEFALAVLHCRDVSFLHLEVLGIDEVVSKKSRGMTLYDGE